MKCLECGYELKERREVRGYAGLPNVTVEATVRTCPGCNEEEVGYAEVEKLHKLLASKISAKPEALVPAEIRFLRTYLGLSQTDLALTLGTARETVSRWESGQETMMKPSERLLRVLALIRSPVASYPANEMLLPTLDNVRTFGQDSAKAFQGKLRHNASGWKVATAVV